jgi:phosphatidylglycerophosphatase C
LKKLALFDFDGTITTKDSFIEFIRYTHGSLFLYLGMFLMLPALVGYKIGVWPNWKAKEIVMRLFWAGWSEEKLQKKGDEFAKRLLPALCRPAALEKIKEYNANGWRVIVISASVNIWLKQWVAEMGVELVATRLVVKNETITGRIAGKNCYGPEKVVQLRVLLKLEEYTVIHAYGDSSGDKEMLSIATEAHYKPFRA